MKLDELNYLKHRVVYKGCYHKNRTKNKNNTSHHFQKSEVLITITIELLSDEIQSRSPRTP